jgi:CheY-like chemotaxis protein
MSERSSIVLVERDPERRRRIHFSLMTMGYRVHSHTYARSVLDGIPSDAAGLICSYELPDSDGISLLAALRKRRWHHPAVLIAPASSPNICERAVAAGFTVVLERPYTPEQLKGAVQHNLLPGRPRQCPVETR